MYWGYLSYIKIMLHFSIKPVGFQVAQENNHSLSSFLPLFSPRLKDETGGLAKDRDHIQNKLEKNVIYQHYLEKVLETAEEVRSF